MSGAAPGASGPAGTPGADGGPASARRRRVPHRTAGRPAHRTAVIRPLPRRRHSGPRGFVTPVRPARGRGLVRARFRLAGPDGVPGISVTPHPGAGPAGAAATRALREAGLAHLGGRLELRTYGRAARATETAHAAHRAVHRALSAARRC